MINNYNISLQNRENAEYRGIFMIFIFKLELVVGNEFEKEL